MEGRGSCVLLVCYFRVCYFRDAMSGLPKHTIVFKSKKSENIMWTVRRYRSVHDYIRDLESAVDGCLRCEGFTTRFTIHEEDESLIPRDQGGGVVLYSSATVNCNRRCMSSRLSRARF